MSLNPFKKKSAKKLEAVPEKSGQETLQEMQQEFNQTMLGLGDLHYRKGMLTAELANFNDAINTATQKLDTIGKKAKVVRDRIQAEVAAKVEEGKDDEQALKVD